jgi:hypothetical protein
MHAASDWSRAQFCSASVGGLARSIYTYARRLFESCGRTRGAGGSRMADLCGPARQTVRLSRRLSRRNSLAGDNLLSGERLNGELLNWQRTGLRTF